MNSQNILLEEIEKQTDEILVLKDRVLVTITGKSGTGKSYIGRYLRKKGIGKYKRDSVAVIDDGQMVFYVFHFFKKKYTFQANSIDELNPFLERMPQNIKIVFFLNVDPWKRITETDILVKLYTDEKVRKERMHKRYSNNPETLKRALKSTEPDDFQIKYSRLIRKVI